MSAPQTGSSNYERRSAIALERIAKALERTAAALEASGDAARGLSEEFDLAGILAEQPGAPVAGSIGDTPVWRVDNAIYSEEEMIAKGYAISDDKRWAADSGGYSVLSEVPEPMGAEDGLESGHDDSNSGDTGDRAR